MTKCCVRGCSVGFKESYHRFPSDIERAKEWTDRINQHAGDDDSWKPDIYRHRVCSKHFLPENYIVGRNPSVLNGSAVPTIFPVITEDTPLRSHMARLTIEQLVSVVQGVPMKTAVTTKAAITKAATTTTTPTTATPITATPTTAASVPSRTTPSTSLSSEYDNYSDPFLEQLIEVANDKLLDVRDRLKEEKRFNKVLNQRSERLRNKISTLLQQIKRQKQLQKQYADILKGNADGIILNGVIHRS